jgi:hypothetical protein
MSQLTIFKYSLLQQLKVLLYMLLHSCGDSYALSVCLSACLPAQQLTFCLPACLPAYLPACLPSCLSVCLSFCLSPTQPFHLSVWLQIHTTKLRNILVNIYLTNSEILHIRHNNIWYNSIQHSTFNSIFTCHGKNCIPNSAAS